LKFSTSLSTTFGINYLFLVPSVAKIQVDILKRLQREVFSELNKLRDRQEKLKKMLLHQKFAGSPFQQARTYVKDAFSVIGSLLVFENDFLRSAD